jgi:capsule polysaccharide export protein KpsE/RkpR
VRDVREAVITEIDRSPTADPSVSELGRGENQARTPALSPLTIVELLWVERSFILRTVLVALLTSTIVAFLWPKHYTATTRLMPPGYGANSEMALALPALADQAKGGGGGGISGGGILGLASQFLGINTSGELFVGVLQSQTVEDRVIAKAGLMSVYSEKYVEDARKTLESHTDIYVGPRTGILSISVSDRKPTRAAEIAKAYVTELNWVLAEVNTSSAHRQRLFLEERLQQIKQQSEADAKEFALFASQNAAVDIPSQAKAMVTAGAELQSQLIVARSELRGLQQIYTPKNVRVRALQGRVDELERQAEKFGGKDVDAAKDTALASGDLYPSVRQLPLLGVKYLDLYRRARVDDAVFELLTKEYEIAKIQEAREVPTAQVLDAAVIPEKSSRHRLLIILCSGLAGFLLAGVYLVGQAIWGRTEDDDPVKVLARDMFSTGETWTHSQPLAKRLARVLRPMLTLLRWVRNGRPK